MTLFGPKRGRNLRAVSLRLSPSQSAEMLYSLRDRRVLLKLGMCVLAIAALIVAVQGWKLPFPFRLDQEPLHGVAAKINFQREDVFRTTRARERAADQVALIFHNDPKPLERLSQDLRSGLAQFAQAATLPKVPVEVRTAFGLSASATPLPEGTPMPGADREVSFVTLKEVASDQEKLDAAMKSFEQFILPLAKKGLVRPEHLPQGPELGTNVTIAQADGKHETAALTEIQLAQLLAPGGSLHRRWDEFPALLPLRPELTHWLSIQTPETLQYDDAATQAARQQARRVVQPILEVYNSGDVLVGPGKVITEPKLDLLRAEYDQTELQITFRQRVIRVATVFLMFLILAVLNGYYVVLNEPKLMRSFGSLGIYLTLLVLAVAVSRALSYDPWRGEVVPVLATTMLFAIAYNQELAILTAFSLNVVLTLSTGADLSQFIVLMSVCAAAVILLRSVPSRSTLVVVGLCSAATYFLMFWGAVIIEDQSNNAIWTDLIQWKQSLRGALWCVAAGFFVSGSLPFIESALGVVTDISLLELGDVSHPLLGELVRRAPGTYNHSITVASIGETAADAIGANGLLVRVGAYFHDIGKMLKPHYFVENTTPGENRHENLAPAMSTLIIIGHVRDGMDLAEQHGLPQSMIDFIEQHHGTTLVEFFYHEATKQADQQPDHRGDANEYNFRYPGPKPQHREAAVLMLSDAVEGASRTLSEPTPKRIERLVHDIAMKRLLDGQFDECGLTITELSTIEESLTKSLIAIYHGRVKYPEQRTA